MLPIKITASLHPIKLTKIANGNVAITPPKFPMKDNFPDAFVKSSFLNHIVWAFKTEINITDVPSPTNNLPP